MKRTILKLLVILFTLLISVGSTIAYLTDVDSEVNVMTLDRVEIDLIEEERNATGTIVEFQDNHPLYPGYYPNGLDKFDQDGYWVNVQNAVDKVVTVKNTGKAPAYVRLWFAFEVTDDDKFFNKIRLNRNTADWRWEFMYDKTTGNFDFLTQDGSRYVVATATYNEVLASGATTPVSLRQVLLDSSATNDDLVKLGDKYSIFVVAQGVQTAGFDNAVQALKEGFGAATVGNHPFTGMTEENAGKTENALVISTAEELFAFARAVNDGYSFVNETVVLGADIDLANKTWTPIFYPVGEWYKTRKLFSGVFDGQGYTISNLTTRDQDPSQGLFGLIPGDVNLVIRNVNIDGAKVSTGNSGGAIVGHIAGNVLVEDCHVSNASIASYYRDESSHSDAGVLVGRMDAGCIKNCSAKNSTVTAETYPGGIVGVSWSANVENCSIDNVTVTLHPNEYVENNGDSALCSSTIGTQHEYISYSEDEYYSSKMSCTICGNYEYHRCIESCSNPGVCTILDNHLINPDSSFYTAHEYIYSNVNNITHTISCQNCNEVLINEPHHSYCLEANDGICAGCGASGVTIGNTWHYSKYSNISETQHVYMCYMCGLYTGDMEPHNFDIAGKCRQCGAEKVEIQYKYVKVTGNDVFVRKEPLGVAFTQVKTNSIWPIVGENQVSNGVTWYYIDVNGTYGYIHGGYVTPITASPAADFKWETTADGKGVNIIQYIGSDTVVIIPSTINNLPVTGIQCPREYYEGGGSGVSGGAFYQTNVTKVIIPDSVTVIGEYAFLNCHKLTSVTIPNSVTDIEDNAFCNCSGLTSITLPEGVIDIGYGVFENCSSLTSITIPDSLVDIGGYAFENCSENLVATVCQDSYALAWCTYNNIAVKIIDAPDNPTGYKWKTTYDGTGVIITKYVGSDINVVVPSKLNNLPVVRIEGYTVDYEVISGAFSDSNVTSITLPGSVTGIRGAFSDCSSLTNIVLSSNLEYIGEGTFSGCSSLKSITIPDSVTYIGEAAFSGCASLATVTLSEGVTDIYDNAFYKCSSLTSIIIPDSVEWIGDWAFEECSNLKSVTLPETLGYIGECVFTYCHSDLVITVYEGSYAHYWCQNNINATINALDGAAADFDWAKTDDGTGIVINKYTGSKKSVAIPPMIDFLPVTAIGDYAFANCTSITNISVSSSKIAAIGKYAFSGCTGLTTIDNIGSLTSVGDYAFKNCSVLQYFYFGEKVSAIGTGVFDGCTSITVTTENNHDAAEYCRRNGIPVVEGGDG